MRETRVPEQRLQRSVSWPALTFFGLGNILGAGIYVLVGKVAGLAGMLAPLSFALASLVALFSALTYARLAVRYPQSAGEAVYLDEAFHAGWLSRGVGILIALAGVVSAATLTRGFAGYFQVFAPWPTSAIVTLLVLLLGVVALSGMRQVARVAVLLTLIEVGGLLLVAWAGRELLSELPARINALVPSVNSAPWHGVFLGAFLAFYAYIGFEDMVNVAEEVKNPRRVMPIAILLALGVATLLYALVAVIAVLVVHPAELARSDAPLAEVYRQATGQAPVAISVIGMLSVINGVLVQMIMASCVAYGMAKKGWVWHGFSRLDRQGHAPTTATWLVMGLIWIFALWLPVEKLAAATSYLILIVFVLVNASLIAIEWRNRRRFALVIPAIGLFSCLGLLLYQIASVC